MKAKKPFELRRLDAAVARPKFSCGDDDIEEFFHKDSIAGCNQLLCVTYALMDGESVKAFFSVLNDAIKKEDLGRSGYKRVGTRVPHEKRYSSMPAAKIGRLGVATDAQRDGWGTFVLDFLKVWFTEKNKTGCRFLVVDAYNTKEVTAFYEKNGFKFLTAPVPGEQTRIMYFDLMPFDSAATDES